MNRYELALIVHVVNDVSLLDQCVLTTQNVSSVLTIIKRILEHEGYLDSDLFINYFINEGHPFAEDIITAIKNGTDVSFETAYKIVSKQAIHEEVLTLSSSINKISEVSNLIEKVENLMYKIKRVSDYKKPLTIDSIIDEISSQQEGEIFYTGIHELDDNIRLTSDRLIVLGGEAGSGKTTLALNLIYNLSQNDSLKILFFSLEMNYMRVLQRLLSYVKREKLEEVIHMSIKQKPKFLNECKELIMSNNIEIIYDNLDYNEFSLIIDDFIERCKNEGKTPVIFLDHIGEIVGGTDTKKNKEMTIRRIKNACREGAICFALVQYMKEVANETNRNRNFRPSNYHIRDTQEIEANADIIIHVWRPEKHGIYEIDGMGVINKMCLIIGKNRDGVLKDIWLNIDLSRSAVYYVDERFYSQDKKHRSIYDDEPIF
jgi:replicative DNA helicase